MVISYTLNDNEDCVTPIGIAEALINDSFLTIKDLEAIYLHLAVHVKYATR